MPPITWKNIALPNYGAANNLIGRGYDTQNDALPALADILHKRDTRNRDRLTSQAAAEALKFGTLDELEAGRAGFWNKYNPDDVNALEVADVFNKQYDNLFARDEAQFDRQKRPELYNFKTRELEAGIQNTESNTKNTDVGTALDKAVLPYAARQAEADVAHTQSGTRGNNASTRGKILENEDFQLGAEARAAGRLTDIIESQVLGEIGQRTLDNKEPLDFTFSNQVNLDANTAAANLNRASTVEETADIAADNAQVEALTTEQKLAAALSDTPTDIANDRKLKQLEATKVKNELNDIEARSTAEVALNKPLPTEWAEQDVRGWLDTDNRLHFDSNLYQKYLRKTNPKMSGALAKTLANEYAESIGYTGQVEVDSIAQEQSDKERIEIIKKGINPDTLKEYIKTIDKNKADGISNNDLSGVFQEESIAPNFADDTSDRRLNAAEGFVREIIANDNKIELFGPNGKEREYDIDRNGLIGAIMQTMAQNKVTTLITDQSLPVAEFRENLIKFSELTSRTTTAKASDFNDSETLAAVQAALKASKAKNTSAQEAYERGNRNGLPVRSSIETY